MSKECAYIRTPVKTVEFSLPYSDNSGERLLVSIDEKGKDVRIETIDFVLISVDDIDWLRQALDDIKEIVKLNQQTITP